jgi:arylsulfatase A-like enzyme
MRFSAPILAGLALAACSNPSTEGEVTGQRLVLRACAGGQDVPSDPVVTRHWDFKAIRAGWTARNGRASLRPKRVVFEFEDQGSIELDEVPAGGFDRIDIYMRAPREGQLRLELKNTDGRTIHRGSIFFGRSDPDQLKKLQFPLQKVRHRLHNIGRVILHFPKDLAQVTLTGITFLSTTPESWLPDPLAPDMMAFGSDRRMSVGLSSRRPLQASFEAQAGTYFSFGCGAPVGLRDGSQPGLTLEFLDGAGKMVAGHEFTVPVGSWRTEQVVIDEALARVGSLTARFSLGPGQDGTVTACALTAPRVDSWLKDPPTVLLLTSDTHRADHLGFMQAAEVDTPTLDRLAREGIAFTDCWAAANVTNPAHISIMTGTGVQDHGIVSNDIPVSPQFLTLAEAFSNQGYRTYAALSVAHLAWGGMEQGFERLSSPDRSQRDSSETIAILEQWLEEDVTQGRPLFVWLHLFDAHAAYKPPPPYDQMYQPGDGEDPFDPANKGKWGEVEMPSWCSQVTDPRYVQALYRGEVTYQDHALGELLKRQPRLGRDLLVFVGDHGENLSDQRPNFDHTDLTTVTQHIPLILAGARVPRHGLVQRPVTQVDVGRTLLDLAGLEGTEFPGDNLLLGLDDPPPDEPVTRFAIQAHALKASAKRGRWYLTHGLYARERAQGVRIRDHEMLLYDLQADPDCLIDVLDEQRDIALELRADLLRWLMDSRVAEFLSNDHRTDEATLRALASLGYSAGSALPDDNPWIDPACECEWCAAYPIGEPDNEASDGD